MSTTRKRPVFYDISNQLVSVRLSPKGDRFEEFAAYPNACPDLEAGWRNGFPLGIRASLGNVSRKRVLAALRRSGLLGYFNPDLIHLETEDAPDDFDRLARLADKWEGDEAADRHRALFVSEDASQRARALAAGLLSVPHPILVEAVHSRGEVLWYVSIGVPPELVRADWRTLLRGLPVVPLHLSTDAQDGGSPLVFAITDEGTVAALGGLGFSVERLGEGDEPQRSDLYLVTHHGPEGDALVFKGLASPGNSALLHTQERVRVVFSGTQELFVTAQAGEEPEMHEHTGPSHLHARKLIPSTVLLEPTLLSGRPRPGGVSSDALPILSRAERATIRRRVTPRRMQALVDRYSGAAPLRKNVSIVSRDINHPHNRLVVRALADDLARLNGGRLQVRLHPFVHRGVRCANVEAVLPRVGLGGVVIVCAHLDSIAHLESGKVLIDRARGADDNASGMAAVLCAARALLRLAAKAKMHREIRFVLFNAEEYDVTGSKYYARDRRQMHDDIIAVFNMDMIGYDAVPPSSFEVHAGGGGEAPVMERSRDLARLVAAVAPEVSDTALVPQFYLGVNEIDMASGRSDHSSFHNLDFPACLISEDFWEDLVQNPPKPDRTPGYHTPVDTVIHAHYAADVARAVAAATWVAATRLPSAPQPA